MDHTRVEWGFAMPGIVIHEWLEPRGGSENVFEAVAAMYPTASLWCLWNDSGGRFKNVSQTALARTPLRRRKQLALPLMPITWRTLPNAEADWIFTSTHLFAHHARFRGPARDAPKIAYVHTPARYIWSPELDARGSGVLARTVAHPLKHLDRKRAGEIDVIACNSAFVAERVERFWNRDAQVIFPPVPPREVEDELDAREQAILESLPSSYILGASRMVPYKRLDCAILAGKSSGMQVVIAGSGPSEGELREFADAVHPGAVSFVPKPSGALLSALYERAAVLVFAPVEDFGIMPVEAMSCGTPVVANAVGGTAESVVEGVTGALVEDWDDERALAAAVERAIACTAEACRDRARAFGPDRFESSIRTLVETTVRA